MPLFILYGGEIVIFLIVSRIALWFLRSGRRRLPPDPGPGPRGTPRPLPSSPARPAADTPPPGRLAA
jgi:hypothetical protein